MRITIQKISMQQQAQPITFKMHIVGMYFHPKGQAGLAIGSRVLLQRDSCNPYDNNAIRVVHAETQVMIGFVAKNMAKNIAPKIDSGAYAFEPAVVTCVENNDAGIVFRLLPAVSKDNGGNVATMSQAMCAWNNLAKKQRNACSVCMVLRQLQTTIPIWSGGGFLHVRSYCSDVIVLFATDQGRVKVDSFLVE